MDIKGIIATSMLLAALAVPAFSQTRAANDRARQLYQQAQDAIAEGRYDRALESVNRLIDMQTDLTAAAMYWKAYSLAKVGQALDALTALTDLQKQSADERWLKDARALEIEIRQASGQPVSPDAQKDEELKLLALGGLMHRDSEQAMPIIEKILSGADTPKVKDRALFLLSQSRSDRARAIMARIASNAANPDLQLRAIRYIAIMGGAENRQLLSDLYSTSSDQAVKRSILRSFTASGDRARLAALARTEKEPALRGQAVQQLGAMGARAELADLYRTETSVEVRKRILQAMFVGGDVERLSDLARNEKDPQLRRTAIRNLGLMRKPGATETLTAIYGSDASAEVRKAVIDALFLQNDAKPLIDLARSEKNPDLKKEIVSKLSLMKSKEATDYLMELLK
jgi:HEAT repeat protein